MSTEDLTYDQSFPARQPIMSSPLAPDTVSKRSDARRNTQKILDAAATLFVTSGVDVPVREVALQAGVGMGTLYRHFPTRADLLVAVYRHQVEACVEAGPALLVSCTTPYAALRAWIHLFVDFLTTKHGLAAALQSDKPSFDALHTYFLDRLVPVCAHLLQAATQADEIRSDVEALELMWGVGSLCSNSNKELPVNARRLVDLLLTGLLRGTG